VPLDQLISRNILDIYIYRTCKIWDIKTGKCIETLRGHTDEV